MTAAGVPVKGGPWLQTHRGLAWCADAPEAFKYSIDEIAHALSNLCRFAGHTRVFYSVAQHSVLVAREVARGQGDDPAHVRAALLHDAAEAFCIDLPSPLKRLPELAGYRAVIERTERAIAAQFGIGAFESSSAVKHADLVLLATEKRDLLGPSAYDGFWEGLPPPRHQPIVGWPPDAAAMMFLDAWHEFGGPSSEVQP